jgi:hypothetical protein
MQGKGGRLSPRPSPGRLKGVRCNQRAASEDAVEGECSSELLPELGGAHGWAEEPLLRFPPDQPGLSIRAEMRTSPPDRTRLSGDSISPERWFPPVAPLA